MNTVEIAYRIRLLILCNTISHILTETYSKYLKAFYALDAGSIPVAAHLMMWDGSYIGNNRLFPEPICLIILVR